MVRHGFNYLREAAQWISCLNAVAMLRCVWSPANKPSGVFCGALHRESAGPVARQIRYGLRAARAGRRPEARLGASLTPLPMRLGS